VAEGVVLAVDRRRDDRQVGSRRVRPHLLREVERVAELREERPRRVDRLRARPGGGRLQRALQADDRLLLVGGEDLSDVGADGEAPARLFAVHRPLADPRVGGPRLEALDELLEVLVLARAEAPLVVDRQLDAGDACPRRLLRVDGGRILAEAGEAAGLERRHDERAVRRVRREVPRAREPADDAVGVRVVDVVQRLEEPLEVGRLVEAVVHVHVAPCPGLPRRGQRGRGRDRDRRQRQPPVVARELSRPSRVVLLDHEQREPRPQPVVRRARGRVPPDEVLVVELDEGEVVRLEVRHPVARLRPYDDLRVDPDHVAGAEQREVLVHREGVHRHVDGD